MRRTVPMLILLLFVMGSRCWGLDDHLVWNGVNWALRDDIISYPNGTYFSIGTLPVGIYSTVPGSANPPYFGAFAIGVPNSQMYIGGDDTGTQQAGYINVAFRDLYFTSSGTIDILTGNTLTILNSVTASSDLNSIIKNSGTISVRNVADLNTMGTLARRGNGGNIGTMELSGGVLGGTSLNFGGTVSGGTVKLLENQGNVSGLINLGGADLAILGGGVFSNNITAATVRVGGTAIASFYGGKTITGNVVVTPGSTFATRNNGDQQR